MKTKKIISVLLASMVMASSVSACSFLGSKVKVDEDDAEDFAVDFCEALLSCNKKDMKNMSEKKASSYIDGLDFAEISDIDEYNQIYEAWFNTLEYEITEIDFDEDTGNASIDVEFTYVSFDSIEPEKPDLYSVWIDNIDSSDDREAVSAKLELVYDKEEDEYHVKAPKKFIDSALDFLDTSVSEAIPDITVLVMCPSWDVNSDEAYLSNEDIELSLSFDDGYGYFDNRDITASFVTANNETYTITLSGNEWKAGFTLSPYNFESNDFGEGLLELTLIEEEYGCLTYTFVNTVAPEVEANPGYGVAPYNEEMTGSFDERSGMYTNEYFNISINFAGCRDVTESMLEDGMDQPLVECGLHPNCFAFDDSTSSLWIVSTATLDPALGPCTARDFADPDHPITEVNGISYIAHAESGEHYLFESYIIPVGDGMIIVYHYSYDFVADNGNFMGTISSVH